MGDRVWSYYDREHLYSTESASRLENQRSCTFRWMICRMWPLAKYQQSLQPYFYVMCTTSLSNQRGFTFSHLHDKSSSVFCETTPPIRIEYPLFVLSLASRSFIHGEALKLTRILLFPLPFSVPLPESKKIGTNPQLSKRMLIEMLKVKFWLNIWIFCPLCSDASGTGRGGGRKVDGYWLLQVMENAWKRQKEKAALWW